MASATETLLRCPSCQGALAENSGALTCGGCGKSFPVKDGIPRFVDAEHYAGSFGFEWRHFRVQRPEEDDEVFRVKTGWAPGQLRGRRVLDAGCGSGRYSAVAARWGAEVASVDLSLAVEKARETAGALGARIYQADLRALPFAPASFDFVFSIGVMHHTPGTRETFLNVARLVKPGGQMALWVYRKNTLPQEALNSALRAVSTRLPTGLLLNLCRVPAVLGGVPIVNKVLGRVVNLGNTDPEFHYRLCDAFDWYSPSYQFHHGPAEVAGWFREAGFRSGRFLAPQKDGAFYRWAYEHDLLIGSGVNYVAEKI